MVLLADGEDERQEDDAVLGPLAGPHGPEHVAKVGKGACGPGLGQPAGERLGALASAWPYRSP